MNFQGEPPVGRALELKADLGHAISDRQRPPVLALGFGRHGLKLGGALEGGLERERLFGEGGTTTPAVRLARWRQRASILDSVREKVSGVTRTIDGEDRATLDEYLESIRDVERRIQRAEQRQSYDLPEVAQPEGIPATFAEHVRLMFDLQALAFASDMTRVFSFKMGRDSSARVFPRSGVDRPLHPASHHGENERSIEAFAQINRYHVSQIPYFLQKLQETMEGDTHLLEKTMIVYGSPMGNPNVHNHKRCPLIVVGGANGKLQGNLHLRAPDGTPMANAMLAMLHRLGMEDTEAFGDSTGTFDLSG